MKLLFYLLFSFLFSQCIFFVQFAEAIQCIFSFQNYQKFFLATLFAYERYVQQQMFSCTAYYLKTTDHIQIFSWTSIMLLFHLFTSLLQTGDYSKNYQIIVLGYVNVSNLNSKLISHPYNPFFRAVFFSPSGLFFFVVFFFVFGVFLIFFLFCYVF